MLKKLMNNNLVLIEGKIGIGFRTDIFKNHILDIENCTILDSDMVYINPLFKGNRIAITEVNKDLIHFIKLFTKEDKENTFIINCHLFNDIINLKQIISYAKEHKNDHFIILEQFNKNKIIDCEYLNYFDATLILNQKIEDII